MARPPQRPLSRDRAWSCIMMNVATPGTGSMRAGMVFTGICQLMCAVIGAALICVWMIKSTYGVVQEEIGQPTTAASIGWLWKWGVVGFAISWSWTFITCVNLFRRARAEEKRNRQNIPPKLADLPQKTPENHP
ncbi:MAG TPA: hypothetical protein VFF11_14995 [Candidatus Binatia bacterium]|nr:hypothetical protein [Candidatus Binatia bacterium]